MVANQHNATPPVTGAWLLVISKIGVKLTQSLPDCVGPGRGGTLSSASPCKI